MNRLWRKLIGLLGIFAILFAQVAVSAYACPGLAAPTKAQAQDSSMPCDDGDSGSPAICFKHCQDEPQKTPDAPWSMASLAFIPLYWSRIAPEAVTQTGAAASAVLLHAPPLPIPIRNCCLRI